MVGGEWVESWWGVLVSCYHLEMQQRALELVAVRAPPQITPTISYPTFWWLPNSSSNYRYIFCLVFISKLLHIPPVKVLLQTYPVAADHVGWSWIQRWLFSILLLVIDCHWHHQGTAYRERESSKRVCVAVFGRCLCGRCRPMESVVESLCCREVSAFWSLVEKLSARPADVTCLTQHPGFEACCLNPFVLKIAYTYL